MEDATGLYKARITPDCARDPYFDIVDDLFPFVQDGLQQYHDCLIIVREYAPKTRKEHYHIIGQTTEKRMKEFQEKLRNAFTSRGFMSRFYTEKELISRSPEYYVGYVVKDKDCEVVHKDYLEHPVAFYRDFYYNEKSSVSDTYLNFMKQRVTVYDEEVILHSILEYYQHVKQGYDTKSVNKLFHLVRGHLFPEREHQWVKENKMLLIQ